MSGSPTTQFNDIDAMLTDDYVIRAPTTTRDDGAPSTSLLNDCRRVFALMEDERHLVANNLYQSVKERAQRELEAEAQPEPAQNKEASPRRFGRRKKKRTTPKPTECDSNQELRRVRAILESKKKYLEKMERKAGVFERAKSAFRLNNDWILSQTLFGVTTYYRREADDSLSIKLEGELTGVPLFEQVAVLKEVDLHYKWAPFCTSSLTVKDLDKLDTVGWFMIGAPVFGMARDGVFRAMGCDDLREDGCILIAGQGFMDRAEDEPYNEQFLTEGLDELDIPGVPTRIGTGRMTIRNFSAILSVSSPTCVNAKLIANIDPRISFIPQALMDFIMRKMCGMIVFKLQNAAKKALSDPVNNVHARRIRQESAFYEGWLLPKFKAFCEVMDWELPEIKALQVKDEATTPRRRRLRRVNLDPESPRSNTSDDDTHTIGDASEAISGITMSTGFTANQSSNGITNFLREIQEKTKRKKEAKVEEDRQRARKIIKPKEFSESASKRLEVLRSMKASRAVTASKLVERTLGDLPEEGPRPAKEGNRTDIFKFLHGHSKTQRLVNLSSLAAATLLILFPELLLGARTFLTGEADSWWLGLLLDVGTFLYLGICGLVHFVLCDVALVYTFDALELGMKTGYQSKKFYSEMTRFGMMGLSAGSVFFGIVKAAFQVWLRVSVWLVVRGVQFTSGAMDAAKDAMVQSVVIESITAKLPISSVRPVVSFAHLFASFAFSKILAVVKLVLWLFYVTFLQSNRIGGLLISVHNFILSTLGDLWMSSVHYVNYVLNVFQEVEKVPTWRGEAVGTARLLLSYSAFFLLVATILFDALSRATKRAQSEQELHFSQGSVLVLQETLGTNKETNEAPPTVPGDESVTPTTFSSKRRAFPKRRRHKQE